MLNVPLDSHKEVVAARDPYDLFVGEREKRSSYKFFLSFVNVLELNDKALMIIVYEICLLMTCRCVEDPFDWYFNEQNTIVDHVHSNKVHTIVLMLLKNLLSQVDVVLKEML